jgi:hypothetical protein
MADYSLSFHDLSLVSGFTEALKCGNTKVFEEILKNNGMDISDGYEIVDCQHRTLTGRVWNGPRVEAKERIDAAWLATGCASRLAQIEAIDDPHLRHTLRKMMREGTSDTAFSKEF